MQQSVEFSFVIPVYNSVISLEEICKKIEEHITPLGNYEVIFIDDCSPNVNTWKTISTLSDKYSEVKGIRLRKNAGKAAALLCGFQEASGNYIVTIDDDLQQDPKDFKFLWEARSHDVVVGKVIKRNHSLFKDFVSWVNHWVEIWAYNKPKNFRHSPYKLFKREIIESILEIKSNKPFIGALICAVTDDIINVDIPHYKRQENESGFTIGKMWDVFSNLLFNNSSILLKLVAWLGIGLSLVCLGTSTVLFANKLITNTEIHNWVILWLTICGIGGVLLFSVGIIGEYLIRIISGVEKRPAYFIKETTCKKK